MEAPECPFCHKKEWRHVCSEVVLPKKGVVKAVERKESAVEAPKGKFDRKAYQREYMMVWRKRKKGGRV